MTESSGKTPVWYYMAYAFELMLYAVRETFLPIDTRLFGLSGEMIAYVGHVIGSVVVMLLWSERFRPLLRVSVALFVCGFVPFLFVPEGTLRPVFGVLAMTGLGCAVTCARCGYAFAATNADRFRGILIMTVTVAGIYLLDALGVSGPVVTKALPLVFIVLLAGSLLKFREEDLTAKKESDRKDARSLYWALAFMIVYFGVDGYTYSIIDTGNRTAYILFCVGIVASAVVLYVTFHRFRFSVWHLWTLFFLFAILMGISAVFAKEFGTPLPTHVFAGLSILGWPLAIYMLACAQARFASYRLLKRCTVIFAVLSPLTTLSDDLVESLAPDKFPVATLIYVIVMLALFLLTLPRSYRSLFATGVASELTEIAPAQRTDGCANGTDRFAGYDLTPRQKEVAELLLEAKTRRQISGELGLSESTVKTHTSELYRKLGINSRVELFRMFGVSEAEFPQKDE